MNRFRSLALSAAALLVLAATVPACSGGGDDDDDDGSSPTPVTPLPDPTPLPGSVEEVEPNDERGAATVVTTAGTGSFAFHGRCDQTGDRDWYAFVLGTGSLVAGLTWDEREYIPAPHQLNDIDVYVEDSSGQIAADDALPPGDSPIDVGAGVGSAGSLYLFVDCYQADDDLFYQGTLTHTPGS